MDPREEYIGDMGGGHAQLKERETFEGRMVRLAARADDLVRERRQTVGSFMELVPEKMREAVEEIVTRNEEALKSEYPGKDINFIKNQVARVMATRLKAVELFAAEDKYRKVGGVVYEAPSLVEKLRGAVVKRFRAGSYLVVTFKGSVLLVDSGAFTEFGGRVIYKRLPLRGVVDKVNDVSVTLTSDVVDPETLRVGRCFDVLTLRTSEVQLIYFKDDAKAGDSVGVVEKLFGAVDTRLAAVLNTA